MDKPADIHFKKVMGGAWFSRDILELMERIYDEKACPPEGVKPLSYYEGKRDLLRDFLSFLTDKARPCVATDGRILDCSELEVNDWVRVISRYSDRCVQVGSIEGDGIRHEGGKEYNGDFAAIPITAELLVRQGFKQARCLGWPENFPTYVWGYNRGQNDHAFVEITIYDKPINGVALLVKIETSTRCGGGINAVHSCDIRYVHELQHALRLCGIEFLFVL